MRLAAVLTGFLLVIAGCGKDEPAGGELPAEGLMLEYTRAGGVGFSIYELRIDADGTGAMTFDGYPGGPGQEAFKLDEPELAKLRDVLESHPIHDFPEPGNENESGCPDAFAYTLAYGGDEYSYQGCNETPPGASAVRAVLADLPIPPDPASN